jgi:hypothetical protein
MVDEKQLTRAREKLGRQACSSVHQLERVAKQSHLGDRMQCSARVWWVVRLCQPM